MYLAILLFVLYLSYLFSSPLSFLVHKAFFYYSTFPLNFLVTHFFFTFNGYPRGDNTPT